MILQANRIGILGDLHGEWSQADSDYFARSHHDLLIFVGDLGSGTLESERDVVARLRDLRVPCLIMPGNNDAEFMDEVTEGLARSRVTPSDEHFACVCGYENHVVVSQAREVTLIFGRPFAMGGSEFSFGAQLERSFGITSLEHSVGRLKRLVDDAPTRDLIFVAHNGPHGLGGARDCPWSRDFLLRDGFDGSAPKDWGDTDLEEAICHARHLDKRVLAVVAGHMHRLPGVGVRPLLTKSSGTDYINAAMVPRIIPTEGGNSHHLVELELSESPALSVRERWQIVANSGAGRALHA